MGDLQCPARFVLVAADAVGDRSPDVVLDGAGGDPLTVLADLADINRGQTLVVVVQSGAVSSLPEPMRPPAGRSVTVELDSDGWRMVTSPGC